MAGELRDLLSGLCLELVRDRIVTTCQNVFHILGELYSRKATFFRGELLDELHLVQVPQACDTVATGTDQIFPAHLNGVHRSSVPGELAFGFIVLAVPDD